MVEVTSCKIAGYEYPLESIVCRSGKCEKCDNGVWEETGGICPCESDAELYPNL